MGIEDESKLKSNVTQTTEHNGRQINCELTISLTSWGMEKEHIA